MSEQTETDRLAKWFADEWPEAVIEGSPVDNAIRVMTEFKMMKQIAKSFGAVIDDPTTPDHIRPNIREALDNYGKNRYPTGDFLRLVLSNDLAGAYGKADHHNIQTMPAIVSYVYNHIPSPSWGNPDKVRQWLAGRCNQCNGTGDKDGGVCPDCKGMGHK